MLEYPLLCFLDIAFQFANINLCHVNSVNFDIEICVKIVVFQNISLLIIVECMLVKYGYDMQHCVSYQTRSICLIYFACRVT